MPRRALLIDDDASVRFVLRNALTETGWQVTEIDDGCEAEDALARQRFNLVVLDLYMPGMNGFEVLRRLRGKDPTVTSVWRTRPDVPVMVISGEAQQDGLSFAARIGADVCVTKPFDIDDVQRIARELDEKPRTLPARPRRKAH